MLFFRIYDFKIGLACEDINAPLQAVLLFSSSVVMDDKRLVQWESSRLDSVKKEKEFFQNIFLPELSWSAHITLDKLKEVKHYTNKKRTILPSNIKPFPPISNYYAIDLLQFALSTSAFYKHPCQIFDPSFKEAYFLAFITYSLQLFAESFSTAPPKNINSCLRTERACAAIAVRQETMYKSRKSAEKLLEHEEMLYLKSFNCAAAVKAHLDGWKAKQYQLIRSHFRVVAEAHNLVRASWHSIFQECHPSIERINAFIEMQQEKQCWDLYALVGCLLEERTTLKQQTEKSLFHFFNSEDKLTQDLEKILTALISDFSSPENAFYISKYYDARPKPEEALEVALDEAASANDIPMQEIEHKELRPNI